MGYYLLINGVHWGYNHLLTSWDIQVAVAKVTTWKGRFFSRIAGWKLEDSEKITPVKMYTTSRIFQFGCCLIYLKVFFFCFRHPLSDHPFSYSLQDPGLGILLLRFFFLLGRLSDFFSPRHPNTFWEGVLGICWWSKSLLSRCLDV